MSIENTNPKQQVKCPHCGHLTILTLENPNRPFCSERCQLIDLGQWADEKFRVPAEENIADLNIENFSEFD